ncbi:unnamed protein product [Closterium sp. NIES-54]
MLHNLAHVEINVISFPFHPSPPFPTARYCCGPPLQVHPRAIPKPGPSSPLPWPAHMLHNLAHVELNAIDLAWDTVVRFSALGAEGEWGVEVGRGELEQWERGDEEGGRAEGGGEEEGRKESLEQSWKLPRQFFLDFVHVADDESRHLAWCLQRLEEMGHSYGDMPAHNLLWRDCEKSANHVQDRLAVIPMVQEARGLDAGPRLVERLVGLGDNRSAAVVAKIAQEEVAHVAVGVAWFVWVCERMGVDPQMSFTSVIRSLCADGVKGPFNHAARATAGLPRPWYDPQPPATAAPLDTVTSSTATNTPAQVTPASVTPASVTPAAVTSAHDSSLDSSGGEGAKEGTEMMVEKLRSGQEEVGKKWRKMMSGQVNRAAREKMRDQLQRKAARIEAHIQRCERLLQSDSATASTSTSSLSTSKEERASPADVLVFSLSSSSPSSTSLPLPIPPSLQESASLPLSPLSDQPSTPQQQLPESVEKEDSPLHPPYKLSPQVKQDLKQQHNHSLKQLSEVHRRLALLISFEDR